MSSVLINKDYNKTTFKQRKHFQHHRQFQQQQQLNHHQQNQLNPSNSNNNNNNNANNSNNQHHNHNNNNKMKLHIPHSVQNKVQRNIFLQALTQITVAFCRATTLHGMKYIVDDIQELGSTYSRQKRLRKLISLTIWATACVMGAVFAIVLMRLIWDRFQTTPTITTVETNNLPIWNVPFPAVTVCNINKVYLPATKNITEKLIEKGLQRENIFEFLENLAKLINPEYIDALYLRTYQILEEMGYTTDKLMQELMQPCDNMIKSCAWLGKTIPCDSLFRVAKSSEGFCCSFNYKALKDSLEIGASNDMVTDQLSNPIYRVSGAGENVGLNILIDVEKDTYVAYSKSFYGAKILIHDAEDFPQTSVTTSIGQPGYDLTIAVIPSVVISEPGIRGLSQQQRDCLFDDERKLRTTNKYTFQSCMTECTVDAIIGKCDCLPFYYPELDIKIYARKYRQCSLHDVKCLRDNRHIFSSLQPPPDIVNETNLGMDCTCLPSCSERRYEVQAILSRRFPNDKLNSTSVMDTMNLDNATTVKVFFKDLTCIKYRRDMYMTWDGLFASFGGIFGLCLGGSVISLVEMVYYFTLRLINRMQSLKSCGDPAAAAAVAANDNDTTNHQESTRNNNNKHKPQYQVQHSSTNQSEIDSGNNSNNNLKKLGNHHKVFPIKDQSSSPQLIKLDCIGVGELFNNDKDTKMFIR